MTNECRKYILNFVFQEYCPFHVILEDPSAAGGDPTFLCEGTLRCSTVQYSKVQYSTVQYSTANCEVCFNIIEYITITNKKS